MPLNQERRASPRVLTELPCQVAAGDFLCRGVVMDASDQGMALWLERVPPTGAQSPELELAVELPGGTNDICRAQVVWARPGADGSCLVGCRHRRDFAPLALDDVPIERPSHAPGVPGSRAAIVAELRVLSGWALEHALADAGRRPERELVRWGRDLAGALGVPWPAGIGSNLALLGELARLAGLARATPWLEGRAADPRPGGPPAPPGR